MKIGAVLGDWLFLGALGGRRRGWRDVMVGMGRGCGNPSGMGGGLYKIVGMGVDSLDV